jgi:hypothetical protein
MALKRQKKWDKSIISGFIPSSDPPGIRTQDPILKRDVLYLLS